MRRAPLDLPLAWTVPGRILPWLAGALVYAIVVVLAIAIVADQAVHALGERARLITVTLPLGDDDSGRAVGAAIDALYQNPSVITAEPVSDAELRALMTPWLGETGLDDLPLPAMIDVRLSPLVAPDLAVLQEALSDAVPGATLAIDAPTPDRARVAATLIRNWSALFALIALPAGLLAIASITTLSLRLSREAVDLLRCMGATPDYLAGQFERYARASSLRGGAGGLGLALITVAIALYSGLATLDAIPIGLRPLDWGLLAGMAAVSLLLAVAVVRISALEQLQQAGPRPTRTA
jgi:cell division transport system permease protein